MKKNISIIVIIILSKGLVAQTINPDLLRVNGLKLYSAKQEIISMLGAPNRTYKPNYDCGFLSEEEQGQVFYSLEYVGMKWTGNDSIKYIIEEINFIKNDKVRLTYGEEGIGSKASADQLSKFFGSNLKELLDANGGGTLEFALGKYSDDRMEFEFIAWKLARMAYWSPC